MKKSISIILAITIMLSGLCAYCAEEKPVTVYVNGIKINFDVEPIIDSGRTLVPLRYIFEALGAEVEWRGEASTAVAKKDADTIEISVGSNILYKNGIPTELDVGAKLIDGRTLVPVRAVSEGMGSDVSWDEDNKRVIIKSKGSYDFSQISPQDEAIVRERYSKAYENIVFESLYDVVKKSGKEFYKGISDEALETKNFINYAWDMEIMNLIVSVQGDSDTVYIVNTYEKNTEDDIKEKYILLGSKLGIGSKNAFSSSYEKTPGGNKVLLLQMKDTALGCDYIGIVAHNEDVRYFLLADLDGKKEVCEIRETGMMTYAKSAKDKKSFLSAIDKL